MLRQLQPLTRGAVHVDLRCCNDLSLFDALERSFCWCHVDEQPSSCTHLHQCPPQNILMICLTESDRRGEASSSSNHRKNVDPHTGVSNA